MKQTAPPLLRSGGRWTLREPTELYSLRLGIGVGILESLNRWIPKRDQIFIYAVPDNEDNTLAVFFELKRRGYSGRIVWATASRRGESLKAILGGDFHETVFCRKNSPRGVFQFLRSRYVFQTSRMFGGRPPPSNQIMVNLWHGMPVKAIGRLEDDADPGIHSTFTVATSEYYRELMSTAVGIPLERVVVTGQPRDDRLFSPDPSDVRRRAGIVSESYSQVLIWLPTFRSSDVGHGRVDGIEVDNPFQMRDLDVGKFTDFLRAHNVLCIVKPHNQAPTGWSSQWDAEQHLQVIDQRWLDRRGLSLYELLGVADVLLTDLSSVYISYLAVDRPILHVFPDIVPYRASRRLLLEPFDEWMAGPLVVTFDELLDHLARVFDGADDFRQKRGELREMLNPTADGRATQRVLDLVGL